MKKKRESTQRQLEQAFAHTEAPSDTEREAVVFYMANYKVLECYDATTKQLLKTYKTSKGVLNYFMRSFKKPNGESYSEDDAHDIIEEHVNRKRKWENVIFKLKSDNTPLTVYTGGEQETGNVVSQEEEEEETPAEDEEEEEESAEDEEEEEEEPAATEGKEEKPAAAEGEEEPTADNPAAGEGEEEPPADHPAAGDGGQEPLAEEEAPTVDEEEEEEQPEERTAQPAGRPIRAGRPNYREPPEDDDDAEERGGSDPETEPEEDDDDDDESFEDPEEEDEELDDVVDTEGKFFFLIFKFPNTHLDILQMNIRKFVHLHICTFVYSDFCIFGFDNTEVAEGEEEEGEEEEGEEEEGEEEEGEEEEGEEEEEEVERPAVFQQPILNFPDERRPLDRSIIQNWFQQMTYGDNFATARLLRRFDRETSIRLMVHFNDEVLRARRAYYILDDGTGDPLQKKLKIQVQTYNRFYFCMLCMYHCTGESYVRGRQPLCPKYFPLNGDNFNFCKYVLEGYLAKRPHQSIMHSTEGLRDLFGDPHFATFHEGWRTDVHERGGFWTPNEVYPKAVRGPNTYFTPYLQIINFRFY